VNRDGQEDNSQGTIPAQGVRAAPMNVSINREHLPAALYSNVIQMQVATNELILNFGLATPPMGPISEGDTLQAEFVARIVVPAAISSDLLRQIQEVQRILNALHASLVAEAARRAQGQAGVINE